MRFLRVFGHLIIITLLTVLTQVGGLIWMISIWISKVLNIRKRFVFPMLYTLFNLFIVPPIAKTFGRENLSTFSKELRPRNLFYPLLFRNYVDSNLKLQLQDAAHVLHKSNGMTLTYLDANFPFVDGFPLLPHLSHNDGKKVDISLMYLDKNRDPTDKKPSVSGYGVYVNSKDNRTAIKCKNLGFWQYDFSRFFTFGKLNDVSFDKEGTRLVIQQLLSHTSTEKIFIEPHLKTSLGLSKESRIRFHGCQAVRHDDHIHLEIK